MTDTAAGKKLLSWPTDDFTQTPYQVYIDEEIFAREQEKIFNGQTWVILGLECELKNSGDYTTGFIGTTPVVLSRAKDNELYGFVNKCAHRGARVVRELRGNAKFLKCLYHGWAYDNKGDLKSVPMKNGMMGSGGYPEDFKQEEHCLRKLKIETISGVVFGSLNLDAPPLREFLGPNVCKRIEVLCHKPMKVWGYQRQTMDCNWKLFVENTRDMYHAPMLHAFIPRFGMFDPSKQRNNLDLDNGGAHQVFSTYNVDDPDADASAPGMAPPGQLQLEEPDAAQGYSELEDGLYLNIVSIFPASLFTCIGNVFTFRQIRPIAPDKMETVYTWFQFEDDDEEMDELRARQSNLFGPAGYVAMEDAEVMESTQKTIARGYEIGTTFVEMGGRQIEENGKHGITEMSIRGFWKAYCRYMEIPTPGAVQAAE